MGMDPIFHGLANEITGRIWHVGGSRRDNLGHYSRKLITFDNICDCAGSLQLQRDCFWRRITWGGASHAD